jgi:uncharacterized protein (TIGR02466 family)
VSSSSLIDAPSIDVPVRRGAVTWRPPEPGKLLPLAAFVPVLRAAVAAAPERAELKRQLARMLYRTHAFAEIIDWLRPMLASPATADAEVLYYLGLSALATDDRALAFEAFHASSAGGFGGAFGYLAEVLTDQDRTDDALAAGLSGLDHAADDYKAFVVVARTLLNRGDTARLWSLCKQLQARGSWSGFIPSAMALAASTPEQQREAAALLERSRWCSIGALPGDMTAFNRQLAREVAVHRSLVPLPATKATVGDGERIDQLELVGGVLAQELLSRIRDAVERYVEAREGFVDHPMMRARPVSASISSWAVMVRREGHESWHIHPDGWISGVYYVDLPHIEPAAMAVAGIPPPGSIEFGPFPFRPSDARIPGARWHVEPQAGMLLLFPSYYAHRTWPTGVSENRIVVAFDVVPSATAS